MIAALGGRQRGRIARRQLLAAGVGDDAIQYRIKQGQLIRVLPGVYAVGHRSPDRLADLWAAHLYAGPDSVFSHQSGGEIWQIYSSSSPLIALTAPRRIRSRPRIRFHRGALPVDEVTRLERLPTTIVSRTIFDLAAVLERRPLERVLEETERRRLGDTLGIERLLARYPGRHGSARLSAVLVEWRSGESWTRSRLEERFIALLDDHGIQRGEANAQIEARSGWFECDHAWRRQRVVVELDSLAYHGGGRATERDAAKRRALAASGWAVVAITWRDLRDDAAAVAADIRRLLAAGATRR